MGGTPGRNSGQRVNGSPEATWFSCLAEDGLKVVPGGGLRFRAVVLFFISFHLFHSSCLNADERARKHIHSLPDCLIFCTHTLTHSHTHSLTHMHTHKHTNSHSLN